MKLILIFMIIFLGVQDMPVSSGISLSKLTDIVHYLPLGKDEEQVVGTDTLVEKSDEKAEKVVDSSADGDHDVHDTVYEELEVDNDFGEAHKYQDASEIFIEDLEDKNSVGLYVEQEKTRESRVFTPSQFLKEKLNPAQFHISGEDVGYEEEESDSKVPDVSDLRIGLTSYSPVSYDNYFPDEYYEQTKDKKNCHPVDEFKYEEKCVPFTEKTCFSQIRQNCNRVPRENCTVQVVPTVSNTSCIKVKDEFCQLKSEANKTCPVVTVPVCYTIHQIQVEKETYEKCLEVDVLHALPIQEDVEDVTCNFSIDFSCEEDIQDHTQTTCKQTPTENCHKTPRKVGHTKYMRERKNECRKLHKNVEKAVPVPVCTDVKVTKCPESKKHVENCIKKDREVCLTDKSEDLQVVCQGVKTTECTLDKSHQCIEEEKEKCDFIKKLKTKMVCDQDDYSRISYL